MKSKKFSVLFAVLALIISTLACAVGGGEPSLTNPRMSQTPKGSIPQRSIRVAMLSTPWQI